MESEMMGQTYQGIETASKSLTHETTRQRLTRAKAEMERRTADIDKAIALLDKNPDTEELLNLLGRVGY